MSFVNFCLWTQRMFDTAIEKAARYANGEHSPLIGKEPDPPRPEPVRYATKFDIGHTALRLVIYTDDAKQVPALDMKTLRHAEADGRLQVTYTECYGKHPTPDVIAFAMASDVNRFLVQRARSDLWEARYRLRLLERRMDTTIEPNSTVNQIAHRIWVNYRLYFDCTALSRFAELQMGKRLVFD